jgi:2-phosphosulfolactate phosphatase
MLHGVTASTFHVHLLPAHAPASLFEGTAAVIVDVLRASTTITHALGAGAASVRLCRSPEEALASAREWPAESRVVGGERGGLPPPGFDLGNSPATYDAARVGGRTVLFTTTNGTEAALHASAAARRCFGCFANLSATVRWAMKGTEPVHVVCAGTGGRLSLDDVLFAGAMAERLHAAGMRAADEDVAALCRSPWRDATRTGLHEALRATRGGRGLEALGLSADIELASRIDTHRVVGECVAGTTRVEGVVP